MIFQVSYDISGYEWVIGLGLMFALAFVLMLMTYQNLLVFFIYLTIFNAFVVWAGLLEMWTLGINISILTVIIIYTWQTGGA